MPQRFATWMKFISIGLILVSVLVIARSLPINQWIEVLENWLNTLGWWGPGIFAGIYIIATVLLLPGSALTLAAGAIFGLWIGLAAVSVGSTLGAGAAFLIGRYFARGAVLRMAERNSKFGAIDRAIGEGGWKIVAMLRLSPVVPFNLQNYMYGLTPIRFWPYLLTSWIAMLPGTFLYVYIGYIARQAAAGDGGGGGQTGKWIFLGVGLLATVVVTRYIVKLAQKQLAEQSDMPDELQETTDEQQPKAAESKAAGGWRVALPPALAVVAIAAAAFMWINQEQVANALSFGPPRVTPEETYERKPDGPTFDHSIFDAIVTAHVDDDGWVDYAAIVADQSGLDEYLGQLEKAPFDELGRDEKLALLINAYNAFTIKLIVDNYDTVKNASDGIKAIPGDERWDAKRWRVGTYTWSLNQIEHEQIRPNFAEPRIHFALVCAAVGCPPLRNEAFAADSLDAQLEEQTQYVHSYATWFRFDADASKVHLTKLYQWYGGDFEQSAGSVLQYVAQYAPALRSALEEGNSPTTQWLDYNWKLNDVTNRQPR